MGRQGRGGNMGRNRSSGPAEMNTVYFLGGDTGGVCLTGRHRGEQ